jgi:hypothetical protein
MSDRTVTHDQLLWQFAEVSEPVSIPVSIPVPDRRWTDAEWAVISRERESYDMDDEWVVFVESDRLFLLQAGRPIFEARFARHEAGWVIAELFVCGNRDVYQKEGDAYESAYAEFLIESVALGIQDGPAGDKLQLSRSPQLKPRPVAVDKFRRRAARLLKSGEDSGALNPGKSATLVTPGAAGQTAMPAATPSPAATGGTVPGACLLCRYKIPAIKTPIGTVDVPVGLCENCNSLSCGSHGERSGAPAFLCILCDVNLQAWSVGWAAFVARGGLSQLPGGGGAGSGLAAGSQPGGSGLPSGRTGGDEAADLVYALASLFWEPDGRRSPLLVQSLEEWAAARPDYQRLTDALAESVGDAVRVIAQILGFEPNTDEPDTTGLPGGTSAAVPGGYEIGDVRSLWASVDDLDDLNDNDDKKRLLASAVLLSVVLDLPVNRMPTPLAAVVTILGGELRDKLSDKIPAIRERVVAGQYYGRQG